MSFATRAGLAVLAVGLGATAIGVVSTKHEARSLFIQLQGLNGERDALEIEWGQLKLEQSAWATHGRVEQTARVGLRMVIPRPDEVRIVKPTTVSHEPP
jgi:cell division protein FtsL